MHEMEDAMKILGAAALSLTMLAAAPVYAASAGFGEQGSADEGWLEFLDTDGNGSVTVQEFKAGRTEQLDRLDQDGDDTISPHEMPAQAAGQGESLDPLVDALAPNAMEESYQVDTGELFHQLDANNDSVLTSDELFA
jgi:hypothetical protein